MSSRTGKSASGFGPPERRASGGGDLPGDANAPPVFLVHRPARQTAPFVYNTPHSGRYYPPDLLAATHLTESALRSSEDCMVDRLFAAAPTLGAPLFAVQYARAYVDCNRERHELDPALFDGPLPADANVRSDRVRAGLGTIPAVVAANRAIYRRPIPIEDGLARIARVYEPTHDGLSALLAETRESFGHVVLIDCHSMPSGRTFGRFAPRQRDDIVLGDCHGQSCAPELSRAAAAILRELGYQVALNIPYSGGYNTQHYGRPRFGMHALQIEINRALYMDERSYNPTARFERVAEDLARFMERLHALPAALFRRPDGGIWRESAE